MDIASLGLAVDSSQVEKGTVELRQLTGAAGQASAAARQLAGASQVEATGQKAATAATHAHNAALTAQNAIIRSSMQQRTMMIYQLNDVAVSLASGMNPAMVAMQQGSQILQGGFMPAVRTLGDLVGGLVTKFWPVAAVIGVVSAGIAGLTYEINKTADTQVGFFDVALAGWQLLAEDIAESFAPVFGQLGTWMQQGWDAAAPVLKGIGNAIIATSMSIGMVWKSWPSIMGDAVITAVNVALAGITRLLNESRTQLAQFLSTVSTLPIPGVSQLAFASLGALREPIQAPQFSNPFEGAMGTAAGAVSDAFGTDYLGGAFDALSARAQKIALARKEAEELGGAAKAANDNFKAVDDTLGDFGIKAFNVFTSLRDALQGIGKGIFDAFKKGGDVAGNVLDMLMGKLEQFASSWLDNIVNNGVNALFGMFGNSAGFGWGVAGGFGRPGIFGIPGMADGGTVGRPGLSWVGERGPELMRLPAGAQIIPNGPSMGLAANSNRPISVQTNIINNAGVEVVERTVEDGQGGVRQEIILNRAIASAVAKPGPAQKAVRSTGQLVRR